MHYHFDRLHRDLRDTCRLLQVGDLCLNSFEDGNIDKFNVLGRTIGDLHKIIFCDQGWNMAN